MSEQKNVERRRSKRWQIAAIVAGGLIFISGLLSYQIGLSASPGFSAGKAALLAAGLILLLVGALGRKTIEAYKAAALILLNTLVLLITIELGLGVVARLSDFFAQPSETPVERDLRYVNDGRENLPYYQTQDWSKDYWREYHAAWDNRQLPFEPYLIWRNQPFEGRALNINDEGLRVTPGAECTPDSYKVFTFGGSTMWGTGVPDWGTIPAFLQSELAASMDQSVCVVNYAEQAWVSTQSVIQLMLALRAGQAPDLVIFYDGNNDTFAAYQSGQAGVPQNLESLAARFENRPEVPPLIALISKTSTYKFVQRIIFGEDYKTIPPYQKQDLDMAILADEISQTYLGNYEIVQALASEYGFEAFFFWQTTLLVDEKPLTEEEQSVKAVAISVYPGYVDLFKATRDRINVAHSSHPALYDLSDVFKDQTDMVFVDPFHVTIEGNQLIAAEMLKVISEKDKP